MSRKTIKESVIEVLAEVVGSALRVVAIGLVLSLLIQWAWNLLFPALAGWPVINYGQACLLYFICSSLFKTAWGLI